MRISDWSSDVCSSDLPCARSCSARGGWSPRTRHSGKRAVAGRQPFAPDRGGSGYSPQASRAPPADLGRGRCGTHAYRAASPPARLARYVRSDRKSVVLGTRVSVRVDIGGRRTIKKKNKETTNLK